MSNDGIIDEDGVSEWYKFFHEKGMEVLQFLVKRKQRKVAMINQQITECKIALEVHKDTPSFATLTNQLNKVLERKDIEIKQRKRRKYLRDTNNYKLEQSYKWQLNLKEGKTGSTTSSPEREVRIVTPNRDQRYRSPTRHYEDNT